MQFTYNEGGGETMGGKNSYESIKRYQDKAYDKVLLRLSKGKKELIQAHAEALGTSVNGFINRAIDEAMDRDKQDGSGEV
jgi:predicted HicB family RNase H-like nuclease